MGATTDKHVSNIYTAIRNLKQAIQHLDIVNEGFTEDWKLMVAAYEKNGHQKTTYGPTLKGYVDQFTNLLVVAAKEKVAAVNAVAAFETFVNHKEAANLNPLKKAKIAAKKKFVTDAKSSLQKYIVPNNHLKVGFDYIKNNNYI